MVLLKSLEKLKTGDKAPDFNLKGIDGKIYSLTDFKDARNDLAHGNISFSEFGSSHPHNEIIDKSRRVSGYLKSVITAFDNCIEEKKYRS